MRFYQHIYVSDNFIGKTASIKRKLRLRRIQPNLYLICLPEGTNELEYFKAIQLLQPYYKKKEHNRFLVIGFAESEAACMQIIEQIVQESLTSEYPCQIKNYLLSRQK